MQPLASASGINERSAALMKVVSGEGVGLGDGYGLSLSTHPTKEAVINKLTKTAIFFMRVIFEIERKFYNSQRFVFKSKSLALNFFIVIFQFFCQPTGFIFD